jgi:hypothetical protein
MPGLFVLASVGIVAVWGVWQLFHKAPPAPGE